MTTRIDTRHMGTIMGAVRTGVGLSLVAAPAWAGRIWVGPDADGHGTKVFARALGARDVALGATTLLAGAAGEPRQVARLVQLGALADAADMAATLIAWRNLEGSRRWAMPLIAVAVGSAGAAVARAVETAARQEQPTTEDQPSAEVGATAGADDPATAAGVVDQQAAVLSQMDMSQMDVAPAR